ncbi:hypothetical protein AB5N19_11163 [Seiridium cardinale]|uniref:Uncharacterized protein n=1 Tax=Seiridium cardinale TaxID=138064 RepID=A0ABR2XS45_9PEZI
MRPQSSLQMIGWIETLRRGERKISRWQEDPSQRVDPVLESLESSQRHNSTVDDDSALDTDSLTNLPGFLAESAIATKPSLTDESKRIQHSFLGLPPEVRNIVYHYCVDYPNCRDLFNSYYLQIEKRKSNQADTKGKQPISPPENSKAQIQLHTPTVLLLCKQVTREAWSILRTRVFVIDRYAPWIMGHASPLPMTSFISANTLRSIRYIKILITLGALSDAYIVWPMFMDDLLKTMAKHWLIKLRVVFQIKCVRDIEVWGEGMIAYESICDRLQQWEHSTAKRGGLLQFEHWILEGDYAYRHSNQFRSKENHFALQVRRDLLIYDIDPIIRRQPDDQVWALC